MRACSDGTVVDTNTAGGGKRDEGECVYVVLLVSYGGGRAAAKTCLPEGPSMYR